MTVCVAVSVDDGIVFAADSAATLLTVDENGRSAVANVYRHGNKVFNLCRGLPICAMTAGMGSIGRAPIHALAKDFRQRLAPGQEYAIDPANYSIEKIATDARKFLFEDRYQKLVAPPPPPHSLEFWIGGSRPARNNRSFGRLISRTAAVQPLRTSDPLVIAALTGVANRIPLTAC
jgi:hypothetical protein